VPTRKFKTQFWCLHSLTVDISAVMPGFGCSSVVPLVQQKT
jgi:hypothetical protein